ncbi:MAG: hypothetical protein IJZ34_09535 [Lachnospiraceae bacterium]|nr:hypothetical protein [Lachnospiraceae bacterium]
MIQTTINRICNLALWVVKTVGTLLVCLFAVSALFLTCYAQNMETQQVLTKWDNLIFTMSGATVLLLAIFLIWKWVSRNPEKRNRILMCLVLCWYVFAGLLLVLFSKTAPAADSYSVYSAAEQLASGNIDVIHATDSYLSYYPQQMGLVAYYEILIRLWNLLPVSLPAYHILKCINVGWACLIILFQAKTVRLLFHEERTVTAYLMMALFNLPMAMYTSFVYGEIPSFALFSIGLWALLKLLHGSSTEQSSDGECLSQASRICLALLSILSFTGSMALRKNTLILMIAVILVTALEALRRRQPKLALLTVCYLLAATAVLPAITSYYEYRSGNELLSGVPPMSYFAMGMQESSRAEGWYNGFNFNTYRETGMDTQATNELSKQAIEERLSYFKQNPGYAVNFYRNKYLSQWGDGTYASRQATLATFGGRRDFFVKLYEGEYSSYYISFCNQFQNLLYLGSAAFCISALVSNRRKKGSRPYFSQLPVYLCLIGVIGGFLFHMIWEANARYILPYSLLLMPYAAWGINRVLERISFFLRRIRKS